MSNISLKRSKWMQKKTPIVYKFEEQAEKTREQTKAYWNELALPKIKQTQRKPKPEKKKQVKEKKQPLQSAYKETDLRDEGYCQFPGCYKSGNHHHIIFRSAGGRNHVANLVTLCLEHHTLGKQSPHQSIAWRRYWEGWGEDRYPEYWKEIRESRRIKVAIGV